MECLILSFVEQLLAALKHQLAENSNAVSIEMYVPT